MRNKLITIMVFIFTSVSFIAGCSQTNAQTESQTDTKVTQTEPVASESRTIIKEFDTNNIFGLKGIYTEDNTITFSYDIDASQSYTDEIPVNFYSCLMDNDDYYITLGTNDDSTYLIRDFEVTEDEDSISITLITRENISYTDLAWININDYLINLNDYRLVYTRWCGNELIEFSQRYHKSVGSWGTMETTIVILED